MAKLNLDLPEINLALDKITWQTWTPTVTGSPATPTNTVNYARYLKHGKRIYFHIDISINSTVSGAGSFSLFFTTPHVINETNAEPLGWGRELLVNGKLLLLNKNGGSGSSQILVTNHDLTSLLVSGYRLAMSGMYRIN